MRESKYPDGYKAKIDYYQFKVNEAIELLDADKIGFYSTKLQYFISRQCQLIQKQIV